MGKEEDNKVSAPSLADEILVNKIYVFRDQKVMLDSDLAELYGVTTGNLNKAVKRNLKRFPSDFMFHLTKDEFQNLIFQNGTSSWGGKRTPPYAFTEQGVAMLSGILNSDRAIGVNIQIMRVFTKMCQLLADNTKVFQELAEMKLTVEKIVRKQDGNDKNINLLFEYIDRLQEKTDSPTPTERKQIGYEVGKKEKS